MFGYIRQKSSHPSIVIGALPVRSDINFLASFSDSLIVVAKYATRVIEAYWEVNIPDLELWKVIWAGCWARFWLELIWLVGLWFLRFSSLSFATVTTYFLCVVWFIYRNCTIAPLWDTVDTKGLQNGPADNAMLNYEIGPLSTNTTTPTFVPTSCALWFGTLTTIDKLLSRKHTKISPCESKAAKLSSHTVGAQCLSKNQEPKRSWFCASGIEETWHM